MSNNPLITDPIVIVEDDLDDQFLLQKVFDRMGMETRLIFFSNGKEAYQFLKATDSNIFLIFCDINMPIMNGLELRAKIHSDEVLRKKSIPFVFLSTAATPADVEMAYDLTVQGFFQKETSLDAMADVLHLIVRYWSRCKHPNVVRRNP